MKKKRILAALLCLMMVVCSLPMVASADAGSYNSIEEIMGGNTTSTYEVEFSASNDSSTLASQGTVNLPAGATYTDADGMKFPTAGATWNFYVSEGWSPFASGDAVYYKLKGGTVSVQFRSPNGYRFMTDLVIDSAIPNGAQSAYAAEHNQFTYDGDWTEFLVVPKEDVNSGFDFYAKGNMTDGVWKKVSSTTGWREAGGASSKTLGLSFIATANNNVCVKSVKCLKIADGPITVEEVMGGEVTPTYEAEFSASNDSSALASQGTVNLPAGATYTDADGMKFPTAGATWNFYVSEGWSPFASGDAVYYKLKGGTVSVQFRSPNGYRFMTDLVIDSAIPNGAQSAYAAEHNQFTYDGDWTEFLVVPKEDVNSGFDFYAKGNMTDGVWKKVSSTTGWREAGGASSKTLGLSFIATANNNVCVKFVKCLKLAEVVEEGPTAIEEIESFLGGEVTPTYEVEFSASNDSSALASQGTVNLPAGATYTDAEGMKFPAAGATWNFYASEGWSPFATGDAVYYKLKGGTVSVQFRSPNGYRFMTDLVIDSAIPNGAQSAYAAEHNQFTYDGDWTEFLVVPKEDVNSGFDFYAKGNMTDGVWKKVSSTTGWREAGGASVRTMGLTFVATANNNVCVKSVGCYKLSTLTLRTGVDADALQDGDTIVSGASLYPIVKSGVSGKLLLVTYDGEDNMMKAQIANAQDLVSGQNFAVAPTGAAKVKVFLWDNFNALNPVVPVITLNVSK